MNYFIIYILYISDISQKIDAVVQPVNTNQKIKGQFKPKERKPPIVNQQK